MKKLLLLLLLTSCVAKKSINKENTKIDSILIYKEKEIVKRFTDTLLIDSPCDSITGQLKPFKRIISVKQGNIILEGINNEIKQSIDLTGYENTIETKYKMLYERKLSEFKETKVKFRVPLWVWLIIIIETLIIYLLLKI